MICFNAEELWLNVGQIGNVDVLDIADFFSNFYEFVFLIFTCSKYQKLGFQKSEIFKHLSSECRKPGFQKSEIFKHPRISKRRMFENLGLFEIQIFNIHYR